jgi:hypothetical protein
MVDNSKFDDWKLAPIKYGTPDLILEGQSDQRRDEIMSEINMISAPLMLHTSANKTRVNML